MPDKGHEEIEILNNKIDELLSRFVSLKEEVGKLRSENDVARQQLHEKDLEINELKELNEKIKLSGALLGDDNNAEEAKRKITEIVREIDKCVALINNNI